MKKITILKTFIISLFFFSAVFSFGAQVLASDNYLLAPEAQSEIKAQDDMFLAASGLGSKMTISVLISRVIKFILSFLGILFFILILYAGFQWMTAAGNEDKISKAKGMITSAIIGLLIVLSAYLITYFVIDNLLRATQQNNAGLF